VKILDTDHVVAILRGQLDLRRHARPGEALAVTAITVAELTHGAHRSARPADNLARLESVIVEFAVLAFDDRAARIFGRLKSELERLGTPVADFDLQIASLALQRGVPLLSHNQKHFLRVPGLTLEDWLSQ
jgi:tRNA(fMet)-specific endonuclease VapC